MWLGTGPEQTECQAWIHAASTGEGLGVFTQLSGRGWSGLPSPYGGDTKACAATQKGGREKFPRPPERRPGPGGLPLKNYTVPISRVLVMFGAVGRQVVDSTGICNFFRRHPKRPANIDRMMAEVLLMLGPRMSPCSACRYFASEQ